MAALQASAHRVAKACDEALADLKKSSDPELSPRRHQDVVARIRVGATMLLDVDPSAMVMLGTEEASVIGAYLAERERPKGGH